MNTKNDKEDGGKKAARCDINVPLIVPASAALDAILWNCRTMLVISYRLKEVFREVFRSLHLINRSSDFFSRS